jgi:hypothetical protein
MSLPNVFSFFNCNFREGCGAGGCSSFNQNDLAKCGKGDSPYTSDQKSGCQHHLAAEAFLIMAVLIIGIALIISIVIAAGKGAGAVFTALTALTAVGFVFNLIGFAIAADYWRNQKASLSFSPKLLWETAGGKWGAGIGLCIVAWILELAAIPASFFAGKALKTAA